MAMVPAEPGCVPKAERREEGPCPNRVGGPPRSPRSTEDGRFPPVGPGGPRRKLAAAWDDDAVGAPVRIR